MKTGNFPLHSISNTSFHLLSLLGDVQSKDYLCIPAMDKDITLCQVTWSSSQSESSEQVTLRETEQQHWRHNRSTLQQRCGVSLRQGAW